MSRYDLIVVGGGTAGLPAAIRAAERGACVLLIEKTSQLGGTLPYAREMSAAGTRQQEVQGIEDRPEWHMSEVQRLAKGYENPKLLKLAVEGAADTIHWLESLGVRMEADTPKIVFNHEPYKIARTYFAEGGGRAVADALSERLQDLTAIGLVTVRLNCRVTGLHLTGDAMSGVTYADKDGTITTADAPSVLLATGGYAASQQRYKAFHNVAQVMAWAPEHASGDGLDLAEGLGAEIVGADAFNLSFGGVLEGDGPNRAIICRLNTLPQFRAPWEIIVNTRGERFIREDEPSIDAQEAALMQQPDYRGFMVFDEHMRREAPDRMRKWYREPAEEDFDTLDWFYRGESLTQLAEAAGIDAACLAATVASYNIAQATGDDALGRRHMPVPIGDGPYYAIRFDGCNVISAAGLRSGESLRAQRADGSEISGLYLAGEILGHGQLMGMSAAGGMMATPAMTFGRLVGDRVPISAAPAQSLQDKRDHERIDQ